MVFLEMRVQKRLLAEVLVAGGAGEGLLSGVGADVDHEVPLLRGQRGERLGWQRTRLRVTRYSLHGTFSLTEDACARKPKHCRRTPKGHRKSPPSGGAGWHLALQAVTQLL